MCLFLGQGRHWQVTLDNWLTTNGFRLRSSGLLFLSILSVLEFCLHIFVSMYVKYSYCIQWKINQTLLYFNYLYVFNIFSAPYKRNGLLQIKLSDPVKLEVSCTFHNTMEGWVSLMCILCFVESEGLIDIYIMHILYIIYTSPRCAICFIMCVTHSFDIVWRESSLLLIGSSKLAKKTSSIVTPWSSNRTFPRPSLPRRLESSVPPPMNKWGLCCPSERRTWKARTLAR